MKEVRIRPVTAGCIHLNRFNNRTLTDNGEKRLGTDFRNRFHLQSL